MPSGGPTGEWVSIVRAADNGISLASDPYGRLLAQVDPFDAGHRLLVAQVPVGGVATVYSAIGDFIGWLSAAMVLGLPLAAFVAERASYR